MTIITKQTKSLMADFSSCEAATTLRKRLENKTATIGIVGLGYVGLPMARTAHDAGYKVIGYDCDQSKIDMLNKGESYLKHLGDELAPKLAASERFIATSDASTLEDADAILLCVPTPLGPHREPDLSFVLDSTKMVASLLKPGQLIVLESTTYPGTTRDEMLPILEKTGLKCGRDFFVAYSPEREDPGRADYNTSTIPKLVGGIDAISTDLAVSMYENLITEVHAVSSAEVAEAAKLVENIYRAVNIAMVNELKTLLAEMGIDIWEVIEAASTKPFGYQPFYPGPGLGGHCIPIDPFYLTWKAKEIGRNTKFIELAGEVNAQMPSYVVSQLMSALNIGKKALHNAKILVIGIAYKPDIDDVRESPAAVIIELLWSGGAQVSYHDPHVPMFPKMRRHDIDLTSTPLTEQVIKDHDCVLIITDHTSIDYGLIGKHAQLIIDTRNAMSRVPNPTAPIIKA